MTKTRLFKSLFFFFNIIYLMFQEANSIFYIKQMLLCVQKKGEKIGKHKTNTSNKQIKKMIFSS